VRAAGRTGQRIADDGGPQSQRGELLEHLDRARSGWSALRGPIQRLAQVACLRGDDGPGGDRPVGGDQVCPELAVAQLARERSARLGPLPIGVGEHAGANVVLHLARVQPQPAGAGD
jgi:hypothetical protein